jgi:cob(I)alamin adenosyltransferase
MASTENVVADTISIKKLGETFITWSEEIEKLLAKVALATIQPGYLDAALLVKQRYNDRGNQQLTTVLTNLQNSLADIGKGLVKISKVYATTEDLNADDLNRLTDVVKKVSKYFPEYQPLPPDTHQ